MKAVVGHVYGPPGVLEEAGGLCRRTGFIDQGRLLAEGTLAELQRRLGGDRLFAAEGDLTGFDPLLSPGFNDRFRVLSKSDRQLVVAGVGERDPATPGTAGQRLSDPRGQIAGNGSGVPITPETRWRLLVSISRDAALEPLDIRIAIELIDKLAAGTRTRLEIDSCSGSPRCWASSSRWSKKRSTPDVPWPSMSVKDLDDDLETLRNQPRSVPARRSSGGLPVLSGIHPHEQ